MKFIKKVEYGAQVRDRQLPKKNSDPAGNVIRSPEHELLNRDVMYIARAKFVPIYWLFKKRYFYL